MATVAEAFALALQNHRAGNLHHAEELYRQILRADPAHADAYHALGLLAYQSGRSDLAVQLIRQAIQLNPTPRIYYGNLGLAHSVLGKAMLIQGNLDEALNHLRPALQCRPDDPDVCCNLGLAIAGQGKFEEAIALYRRALQLHPDFPEAHNNLAIALVSQGKLQEAVAHCREALRLRPNFSEAHNNLGKALQDQRELPLSVESYRQGLHFNPGFAEAHYNLGNALRELGRLEEAFGCFQESLRLKPNFPFAHNNLGYILLKRGWLDKALNCFRQALQLQPGLALAQSNFLFCLNYDPEAKSEEMFEEHRRWGQLHEPATPRQPHPNERSPDRRLRVGYVSPDLRRHALARYFEPVLGHHDPQRVEVFCYAEVAAPDEVTARLQKLAHTWRWTCPLTNPQLCETIREDGIDILVDLAGHTAGNRLPVFANKPAPVQATWLGYLNTTGLTGMDYRLTDDLLDPPSQPVRDTEELMRLPNGMCCFAPPADAPPITPLPAITQGRPTFGSLHNLFKLNARVFDLWARALQAVPTARLLILRDTLTPPAADHIRRQFAERGVGASRLDLRQVQGATSHLEIYKEIDVSLDTLPYSGGVITCESLWMGVPVLSLAGERPAGRNSAALLTRTGLADWVASAPEEFVSLAVKWTTDMDRLAQLRSTLRDRMTATLCDADRFTRTLEDAYRNMWRRWCARQ